MFSGLNSEDLSESVHVHNTCAKVVHATDCSEARVRRGVPAVHAGAPRGDHAVLLYARVCSYTEHTTDLYMYIGRSHSEREPTLGPFKPNLFPPSFI